MKIHLVEINVDNWYDCSQLEVRSDQEEFVSSNLLCIAEAQFYPSWGAYAIYKLDETDELDFSDGEMIGFAMYEHDEDTAEWWISSLMIAAEHQGQGYGRQALTELIQIMAAQGCPEILVGYDDDNEIARHLYQRAGFVEIGLDEEGDMVARRELA